MRYGELAGFALGGLWRQKMRTTLTLVGVSVGTCALVFSLSLGFGLRAFIDQEFKSREDFWRIIVHTSEPTPDATGVPQEQVVVQGDMSEHRRERLHEALVDRYLATRPRKPSVRLTPDKIRAIAALPNILEVRTFHTSDARVIAEGVEKPAVAFAVTGPLADLSDRIIAGRLPAADQSKEIVVSELVLYDLGWRSDAELENAIGKPITLMIGGMRNTAPLALARLLTGSLRGEEPTVAQAEVLRKLTAMLPQKLDQFDLTTAEKTELKRLLDIKPEPDQEQEGNSAFIASDTFRIAGVVRILTHEDRKKAGPLASWELNDGSAFLSPSVGQELFSQLPWARDAEVHRIDVRVSPGSDLPATVAAVESMGFATYSSLKWFANARREVTMIAGGLNLFALIALLVAGIGITNTLVTSVIERTGEIGILRAVGATRGQILALFLTEGTLIGLVGSMSGLVLARLLAIPADHWVWTMIEKQSDGETLVTKTVFIFPSWLWVGAVVFAVIITMLAAYYPARRAARIHPIEALRYG